MADISGRYARALFQTGLEDGDGRDARYGELLDGFIACLSKSPEMRTFFMAPQIGKPDKKRFLSDVFADPADAHFLAFLKILVDKDRMESVERIGLDYRGLLLASRNTREAIIESAFPMNEADVEAIKAVFMKKTGAREIRATVKIVPELIGGVRVTIGSAVYDGTARAALDRLRETMKE
jgi:F-type H+-transporting ATPase subunit delta